MTNKQFMEKYTEIANQAKDFIIEYAERVIKSGCVDLESKENNYRLPKNVLVAASKQLVLEYSPIRESDKKEINNIFKNV